MDSKNLTCLSQPRIDGTYSVEKALQNRRSIRAFKKDPLSLAELSQLAWSAQGVSNPRGYRTAPSAGALYPLEVYIFAGNITGLDTGIYKYAPRHILEKVVAEDRRADLARAALNQSFIATAPVVFLFSAIFARITNTYGERGKRYVFMEAGHAAQNLCLQAVALGMGTTVVGAFQDDGVAKMVALAPNELPIYIVAVGKI
jgi:SagB-type dehydrogenase family enzyme